MDWKPFTIGVSISVPKEAICTIYNLFATASHIAVGTGTKKMLYSTAFNSSYRIS
jgi:hypothetical protein